MNWRDLLVEHPARLFDAMLVAFWAYVRFVLLLQYLVVATACIGLFGILISALALAAFGIRWGW